MLLQSLTVLFSIDAFCCGFWVLPRVQISIFLWLGTSEHLKGASGSGTRHARYFLPTSLQHGSYVGQVRKQEKETVGTEEPDSRICGRVAKEAFR